MTEENESASIRQGAEEQQAIGLKEMALKEESGQSAPPPQEMKEEEKEKEKASIILGKGGEPLSEGPLVIGIRMVEIPSEDEQRAGFPVETEDASRIISQFPQFKHFKLLGQ